jgi:hypothetical protein
MVGFHVFGFYEMHRQGVDWHRSVLERVTKAIVDVAIVESVVSPVVKAIPKSPRQLRCISSKLKWSVYSTVLSLANPNTPPNCRNWIQNSAQS